MRNFLIGVGAIIIFGYLGGFIAWWGIALVALIVGFALQMNGGLSFLSGLIGGSIFTAIHAIVINNANEGILVEKMNSLLGFDALIVTVLIGGLLSAMGCITGKYLRDSVLGEVKKSRYRTRYR
jgi:hypothetical protein